MTKIKICGLRRTEDIKYANEFKPDFIGFVFYKPKFRYIPFDKAADLRSGLDKNIKPVGVFVNEPVENIISLLKDGIIDSAQLHGDESEDYIREVKDKTGKKVIKAFTADSFENMKKAENSRADFILLDNGKGTGKSFDRKYLEGFSRPYFLAGGLSPENVYDNIISRRPFAVDVSTGVETDKFKDRDKIKKFMSEVKRADETISKN